MSVLVLAVEKPFWQDVLTEAVKLGADIGHAAVHYKDSQKPQQFFKTHDVKLVDGKMFYTLRNISALLLKHFPDGHVALDKKVIDYFAPLERDFYILTDRFCYFPISFNKRKRIFREALRFWLTYFQEYNITQLFTTCSPHSFADYTSYHVAKYLGVPVLQLADVVINDHILLRHDYREEDKVPEDYLAGSSMEEIKTHIPPQLLQSAFQSSSILKYVIRANNVSQQITKVKKNQLAILKKSLYRAKSDFGQEVKFKGPIAMNDMNSKTLRRLVRWHDAKWRKREQEYYNSKVVSPDFSQKYIYFAMHLQPERTSTPEATIFEDHLLALQILAKSLPDGWKLYVKENPRQFDRLNALKGAHHRDRTDFDDFLRLPNVQLISQKISSQELATNAQIVSTLLGSVGWESLQNGKPVIIFGYSWYKACRACFKVGSVDECKAAIAEALKLTSEEIERDVLKYLAYMKNKFIVGNLGDEDYVKNISLPYETHVKSIAENMLKEFTQ